MNHARRPQSGLDAIGDVAARALNSAFHDGDTRSRPGRGLSAIDFGLDALRMRASLLGVSGEMVGSVENEAYAAYDKGAPLCESPIERSVLGALIVAPWIGFMSIPAKVHDAKKDTVKPPGDVVIVPQMAFIRYRFDFGLVLEIRNHFQFVAVECDGEDFHQDFAPDALRDNFLLSWGIQTFRLKGKDIERDPNGAVEGIVRHACDLKLG